MDVRQLIDLARDKSTQGRSQLVSAIGDLMDDSGRILSLQEKALMNDILKKLIQDVARPIRKALAEKLSQSPNAPQEVVQILGNDEFDIASPILLTWMLNKWSGAPILEKGLKKTRPGYADYVARTSGFVPWPPRKG